MKAVRFDLAIPRYAAGMALGKIYPPILWSGLSCTYFDEVPEPPLPTPAWVRVRTRLGGICGTDTGTIKLHTSPYYSPFSSFPFTLGHENVGTLADGGRVVVEPLLWCGPRGFTEYCEFCARGEINLCERVTAGDLAAGLMTGTCADTGGSWSAGFVAHPDQVYRVPLNVSDENAVLVEPFAIGLHAALLGWPGDGETVLIVGAGTIGLMTLAALRALGSAARVLVLARYPFQAEAARRLGVNEVFVTKGADAYTWVAEQTGGTVRQPIIGKRVVSGGADKTFECVGSDAAIDDALRLTRNGGLMVLEGLPGIAKGVDWTAIFAQELTVRASQNYHHVEPWGGKTWRAFDLALHLMATRRADIGWMVTHRYKLADYKTALKDTFHRGDTGMIKGVFEF